VYPAVEMIQSRVLRMSQTLLSVVSLFPASASARAVSAGASAISSSAVSNCGAGSSVAPRAGSRRRQTRTAVRSPGTPTIMKAARQPK
jgi:hypothetical protein